MRRIVRSLRTIFLFGLQFFEDGLDILLKILPEHAFSDLQDERLIYHLVFLVLFRIDALPELYFH